MPCTREMRTTVYDVLSYLVVGMTSDEVLEDFPYLTRDNILACLVYAANRNGSRCCLAHETPDRP